MSRAAGSHTFRVDRPATKVPQTAKQASDPERMQRTSIGRGRARVLYVPHHHARRPPLLLPPPKESGSASLKLKCFVTPKTSSERIRAGRACSLFFCPDHLSAKIRTCPLDGRKMMWAEKWPVRHVSKRVVPAVTLSTSVSDFAHHNFANTAILNRLSARVGISTRADGRFAATYTVPSH